MLKSNKKMNELILIKHTKNNQKVSLKDNTMTEAYKNMKKIIALIEKNEELRNFDFFLKRK